MTGRFNMAKQDYKPYRANLEGLNGLGTFFCTSRPLNGVEIN